MFRRGDEISWTSNGPKGVRERVGIVRAYVKPGKEIKLPKRADPAKFKAALVNTVHARYLVEIQRVHKNTGRKLKSHWMAPKAVTLERLAVVVSDR